jgi:Resolvase, N terminal domain
MIGVWTTSAVMVIKISNDLFGSPPSAAKLNSRANAPAPDESGLTTTFRTVLAATRNPQPHTNSLFPFLVALWADQGESKTTYTARRSNFAPHAGLNGHTQAVDTTTPTGRAMFGMLGVFAEFEREMIVARVNTGLDRAKREGTVLGRWDRVRLRI